MRADPRLCLSPARAARKDAALRSIYGIDLDDYTTILRHQGWKCPVCGKDYTPDGRWSVDHQHQTGPSGPVRGVLCLRCNSQVVRRLTMAEAAAAAAYLAAPPAPEALGREVIARGRARKPRGVRNRRRKR